MTETGTLDSLTALPGDRAGSELAMAVALAEASAAIARLDQALASHPLRQAFLYRARLEAVRRQAEVDGALIDPWHLAATLEGLRLRMDPYLRIIDRGVILDAARTALTLHQWLVEPDFDQEGEVQRAERAFAGPTSTTPLLLAAGVAHAWLDGGEERAPIRAALARYWKRSGLLRTPVPLTGARSLSAETPWRRDLWRSRTSSTPWPARPRTACTSCPDMECAWLSALAAVCPPAARPRGRRRRST